MQMHSSRRTSMRLSIRMKRSSVSPMEGNEMSAMLRNRRTSMSPMMEGNELSASSSRNRRTSMSPAAGSTRVIMSRNKRSSIRLSIRPKRSSVSPMVGNELTAMLNRRSPASPAEGSPASIQRKRSLFSPMDEDEELAAMQSSRKGRSPSMDEDEELAAMQSSSQPEPKSHKDRLRELRSRRTREQSYHKKIRRVRQSSRKNPASPSTNSTSYLSETLTPGHKKTRLNIENVNFPDMVEGNGLLKKNVIPKDPVLQYVNVGDLFWHLEYLEAKRSKKSSGKGHNLVKKFLRKVFTKMEPSKEAKSFCKQTNSKIEMFNNILENRDYEVTPKKLSFKKKRDSKEKADPVGVLHFLCNTIRDNLHMAVPKGGLVSKALKNHNHTVRQIRRLCYVLECNHTMLKVINQIHTYNGLGWKNLSLVKRRGTLRTISQRIQSALGLRDHNVEKLVNLVISPGPHFGRSIKAEPAAPAVQLAASRLMERVDFEANNETLLWEEVPGYPHRIPCVLTTLSAAMHELDAFRIENVFGMDDIPPRKLRSIRANLEAGQETRVGHGGLLAALMKHWLEELPEPILQVDKSDGYLMKAVMHGAKATEKQIQDVLAVDPDRGVTDVQQAICTYILNLLAVTVESNFEGQNSPRILAMQLAPSMCHKSEGSRKCNRAVAFLERCIEYQVESRRCHPIEFVPSGSISPLQRAFLTKMLITADNMHKHLGMVEELEKQNPTDALIRAVEGGDDHAAAASTPMSPSSKTNDDSPAGMATPTGKKKYIEGQLSGFYNLEKTASPFHIPAEHLKPFYKDWKAQHSKDVSFQRYLAFHRSLAPSKARDIFQNNPEEWMELNAAGMGSGIPADKMVVYLDTDEDREFFHVHFGRRRRAGRLYNTEGQLFDTTGCTDKGVGAVLLQEFYNLIDDDAGKKVKLSAPMSTNFSGKGFSMCVYSEEKGLFCASHQVYRWHHSSLLAGEPCLFAGELKVERGVLKVLTNKSGHYKPGELRSMQMMEELLKKGVELDEVMFVYIDKNGKTEHPNAMMFLESLREKHNLDPNKTSREESPAEAKEELPSESKEDVPPPMATFSISRRHRRVSGLILKPPRHNSGNLQSSIDSHNMGKGESAAEPEDEQEAEEQDTEEQEHRKRRRRMRRRQHREKSAEASDDSVDRTERRHRRRARDPTRRRQRRARREDGSESEGRAAESKENATDDSGEAKSEEAESGKSERMRKYRERIRRHKRRLRKERKESKVNELETTDDDT